MPINNVDYLCGAGKLYFDQFDANGNPTGNKRWLGDCSAFGITVESEEKEHQTHYKAVSETDLKIRVSTDRTGQITVDNLNLQNISLFIGGDIADVTQVATPVVDESHLAVVQGHWIRLGESLANPTGVRNVSSVVVTDDVPNAAFTEGTDYILDAANGMIQIVEGGAITDGTNLLVDYTPAAETREQITVNATPVRGELTYIADNTNGENKDVFAPNVELVPNGNFEWIGQGEVATAAFDVSFNVPTDTRAALYIDGRAAA